MQEPEPPPDHIQRFRQRRHPVMWRVPHGWSDSGRALSICVRRRVRPLRRFKWRLFFTCLGLVVSAAMLAWGIVAWHDYGTEDAARLGDLVGGFAGGLGFIGMVVALLMQMRELRYQREELRLTRKEMKTQTRVLSAHADAAEGHADLMRASLLVAHQTRLGLDVGITTNSGMRDVVFTLVNKGTGVAHIARIFVDFWFNDGEELYSFDIKRSQVYPYSIEQEEKLDAVYPGVMVLAESLDEPFVLGSSRSAKLMELSLELRRLKIGDIGWQQPIISFSVEYHANIVEPETQQSQSFEFDVTDWLDNSLPGFTDDD